MKDQQDRLIRYLDNCWAVEKTLVSEFQSLAEETSDPTIRAMFEERRKVTQTQETRLEARIRALGKEPSKSKSFFTQVTAKIADLLQKPHDEEDRPTQHLIKAFTVQNLEMAMYHSLAAYAEAIGDQETGTLARNHLQQEKDTAARIWSQIAVEAKRPAEMVAAAP